MNPNENEEIDDNADKTLSLNALNWRVCFDWF